MSKKVILLIMDGWGIAEPDKFNAIANAPTPNIDKLVRLYPNTLLRSDGENVGLDAGQFGTSEINHLTIGSGRIIIQDLTKINKAIREGEFKKNQKLIDLINHVQQNKSNLHLIGIISDGGVHSHIDHLFAIFDTLEELKFQQPIFLHLFSDGRDVAPKSVEKYLEALEQRIAGYGLIKPIVATLQGRFYLDRDRDWEKTDKAFELIVNGIGNKVRSWKEAINLEYNNNRTDEVFGQFSFSDEAKVRKDDGILFFHYRTDRQYQLTKKILNENIPNLAFASFIKSSEEFSSLLELFPREDVNDTLAETISKAEKKQLHITETEKYAHLTYFFNGEREQEFVGEKWELLESNRFVKPKYDLEPSMHNYQISQKIIEAIAQDQYDFIVANLPSPDMVGHTGNYEAAVVSAQSVDYCVGKIYEALEPKLSEYALLVTADHGNSDIMWDYKNNQPHTQHTLSPVPFILVTKGEYKLHRRDSLQDIAPTILDLMGIQKPIAMRGESLIIN